MIDFVWRRSSSKTELVAAIAHLIGVAAPPMSTGSTEPKRIFELVNERLALGIDPTLDKPNIARAIVECAGFSWSPDSESRGGTVTREGLTRVYEAVVFFVDRRG